MSSLRATGGNTCFFLACGSGNFLSHSVCDVVIIQNLTAVKFQSDFFYLMPGRLSQSIDSKEITILALLPSFKLLKKLSTIGTID
jgi:hypothetical protein